MKVKGNAPQWAIDLLLEVCKANNRQAPKKLIWRNANRDSSSGFYRYYYQEITINAGQNIIDQKHVVLHEASHHINNRSKKRMSSGHTVRFWKIAFKAYQNFGDIKYSAKRESSYKVFATTVYEKYYKED